MIVILSKYTPHEVYNVNHTFEVGADLESLSNDAFGNELKVTLHVLHLQTTRLVATQPKLPVNIHLQDSQQYCNQCTYWKVQCTVY